MAFHYNDTLEQQDVAEYKSQAVNAKFKQQVAYGLGAALVFGLVSAMAKTLFDTALGATAASAALPVLGLVALGVAGVGLLYLSAKFLSENTLLDQHLQAKQISSATRGHAHSITQGIETKGPEFPALSELKTENTFLNTAPSTVIGGERELADTITLRVPAKAVADGNWSAQMQAQANEANPLARAV